MNLMAMVPLAFLAVAIPSRAQTPAEASGKSVDELVAQIESGQNSLEAFCALVERAKQDRLGVLAPVDQILRTTSDAGVRTRCKAVLDAIVKDYLAEHKKREIEERYDDLQTACKDLVAAARKKKIDGTADVEKALEALETSLATPEPLDAPPLSVPTGTRPPRVPKAPPKKPEGPAPGLPSLEGYKKIQVGDKTVMVPADSLPEHYVAELVNGQVMIIRFKSAAEKEAYLEKKKEKEKGKTKKKDQAPRPERP